MPLILEPDPRRLLVGARRATLATTDAKGRPRLVPVCFVLVEDAADEPVLYTPVDEKPKRAADPLRLARVLDIEARPGVVLLADRWSEDWSELAWVRLRGDATMLAPDDPACAAERTSAIARLRTKYRQYAAHDLEGRPLIRIVPSEVVDWSAAGEAGGADAAGAPGPDAGPEPNAGPEPGPEPGLR